MAITNINYHLKSPERPNVYSRWTYEARIFSSNQPRHLSLVKTINYRGRDFFISESILYFQGKSRTFSQGRNHAKILSNVMDSESKIFGNVGFLPSNEDFILNWDLNKLERLSLWGLESDVYIVFGSSYIKGWLADFLCERRAINIHMGLSPFYRGSSCNFWALYDNNPGFVGATIHLLS